MVNMVPLAKTQFMLIGIMLSKASLRTTAGVGPTRAMLLAMESFMRSLTESSVGTQPTGFHGCYTTVPSQNKTTNCAYCIAATIRRVRTHCTYGSALAPRTWQTEKPRDVVGIPKEIKPTASAVIR